MILILAEIVKSHEPRSKFLGLDLRATLSIKKDHDAPDTLALMHIVKGSINLFEGHGVGDQFIQLNLAAHILIDHARAVGFCL